jgi:predicted ATPase
VFKHALVQDAAYGTLLREPRRALHARIAQTLGSQFAEIADYQPELIARHCAEAGLIEKAAVLWGRAGQRSLERSAFTEAAVQFNHALEQTAKIPGEPTRRGDQIKLQVGLVNALMHVKGMAASETKAAEEQAYLLMQRAEALGENPEDPLLFFSVLSGFWLTNLLAFNGDALRELSERFLGLAETQRATGLVMIGHRLMGTSLLLIGEITAARTHFDQALALYNPAEHRTLTTRFGLDHGVSALYHRSWALWILGYPTAAMADADQALKRAREIDHAPTLGFVLSLTGLTRTFCGYYAAATTQAYELARLAEEKGAAQLKAAGMMTLGWSFASMGKPAEAVKLLTSGTAAYRSTGARVYMAAFLPYLARAYMDLGEYAEASRCIDEAMNAVDSSGERLWEAEVYRSAGEIALKPPEPDLINAERYFGRALSTARLQQAKSWELRAAMSMARLWRDQGKRDEARELLAPVYGWFTEGFGTLDLKDAKALLDELTA